MRSFFSKLWAIISIVLILGSFMFGPQLQNLLLKAPFMRIDPKYSGGGIEKSFSQGNYTINIHQEVFPALTGEGRNGFRQITITKINSDTSSYNIDSFDVGSDIEIRIVDNVPYMTRGGRTTKIDDVGLSECKLIMRINAERH